MPRLGDFVKKKMELSTPLMNSRELVFLHRARGEALRACMQGELP
jgi:hypothetical protein